LSVFCSLYMATVFNESGPNLARGLLIISGWPRGVYLRGTARRLSAIGSFRAPHIHSGNRAAAAAAAAAVSNDSTLATDGYGMCPWSELSLDLRKKLGLQLQDSLFAVMCIGCLDTTSVCLIMFWVWKTKYQQRCYSSGEGGAYRDGARPWNRERGRRERWTEIERRRH